MFDINRKPARKMFMFVKPSRKVFQSVKTAKW